MLAAIGKSVQHLIASVNSGIKSKRKRLDKRNFLDNMRCGLVLEARSSGGEHYLDTVGVSGSNPLGPTDGRFA